MDRDPGAPHGPDAGADCAGPGRSPLHAAVVANGVKRNLSQMDNPSLAKHRRHEQDAR